MPSQRVQRKISVILSADVADFSRLMGDDEINTVRTMESYRETFSSHVQQFDGRVVDSPGDNILCEFASVVDAVQCAVEIQQIIMARNTDLPGNRVMEFRIGINLGDVIVEGDRIYGDGVNIAARIEGLADPGGICISGSAYEQIVTKLSLGYENLGEHTLKNISRPIRVYRIPMVQGTSDKDEGEKGSFPISDAGRNSLVDKGSQDKGYKRKSEEIEGYYIGGFVCIACAVGLPILGFFLRRINPKAFFPIAGVGILVGMIGVSLILFGKFLDRRARSTMSGDRPK